MLRRFAFWFATFLLAGQAQAGFCYTPLGDSNIDFLPQSYQNHPKAVVWRGTDIQSTEVGQVQKTWKLSEYFTGEQRTQTVLYANNSKTTETYNYENGLWVGGLRRQVKLKPDQIYNNSEKLLDELESKIPFSGTSNDIVVKYDTSNRPIEYVGVVDMQHNDDIYGLKINCDTRI